MVDTIVGLIGGTILFWFIMPIIHELGHALAGWIVGLQQVRIHWRWPTLKTTCQFTRSKPENFCFSVGGVVTQGIFAAVVVTVMHSPIVTSLVASYGVIIAINLLPLWPADGYYLHTEVFTESKITRWALWILYGAAAVFALTVSVGVLSSERFHGFAFWWVCAVTILAVGMSVRRTVIMYAVSYKGDVRHVGH